MLYTYINAVNINIHCIYALKFIIINKTKQHYIDRYKNETNICWLK